METLRTSSLLFSILTVALSAQTAKDGYVGSKACYGCHTAIYKSYQRTAMAQSMTPADSWTPQMLPSSATIASPDTTHSYEVKYTDSGWRQSEADPGQFSAEYPLDYAVGTGVNGISFVIRRGNQLFQAPLSYYSQTKSWLLSPGYEKVDFGFSRLVPQECINCHAGRPSLAPHSSDAFNNPAFAELAVGCENCHGPGQSHVASFGKSAGDIVNPAKLSHALADQICANCHQSGDARVTQPGKSLLDFRPGQWLIDTSVIVKLPDKAADVKSDLLEHYSAMRSSRCFRQSKGQLGCTTCHNPHVQVLPAGSSGYFKSKCLACHSEQSCKLTLQARNAQPNPDNCIGCHMPKRSVTQISHSALTNHRIPARLDLPSAGAEPEITEGVVIVNPPDHAFALPKITLLKAYQQLSSKSTEMQAQYLKLLDELSKTQPDNSFVQAALGDQAFKEKRFADAVPHLKQGLAENRPSLYLELGQAFSSLGQTDEAVGYLKKGIELAPYDSTLQKTLILEFINQKSYDEARRSMQAYVDAFPEDSFMRGLLARVSK